MADGPTRRSQRVIRPNVRISGAEWIKPDAHVYATTITCLGRLHDADHALQVLEKMREAWVQLWELTCNSMVGVLVKVGRMDEILHLKDQMMLAKGKMDVVLARMLMHVYYLSGEVGKTLELFDVVASDGVTLSNVAYGVMNKGCEEEGMTDEIYKLCTYEFNLVIRGLLRNKQWKVDIDLLELMVDTWVPHFFTYSCLIHWLYKHHKLCEAVSLWDKMTEAGVNPSIVTYHTLMLGYCQKGCRDKALKLYSERLDEGFPSNEASYLKLMKGYIKKKTVDKAYALLNEMRQNGALDEGFKQAKSEGYNMEMVVAGAGCVFSPPRGIAGRRGSARTIIVHKVAEEAKPASEVDVTMGVALSVCTLPEQVTSGSLGQRQLELGLRIHGELGVAVVELQSVDIVAEHVLKQIVSRETQYLPNTRGCNDVLLVNGLGATPIIELMIAAVPELQLVYDIAIDRVYTGTLLTSLDMAGLSITVMKSDQSILRRLDVPTKALAWPVGYEGTRPPAKFHVPLAPSPSMKDDEILAPSQELSKQFLMFHMHQQSFPCAPTWGQVGSLGGGNVSSSRCYTKVKDGSSGCSTEAKPCKTRRSKLLKLLKEGS
jgi:pentatricopeptide repeat protein